MSENIEWLRMDNVAKIYPSTGNSRWNNVYRISALMKQRVDPEILQEALEATIKRYPSFQVTLKKGVFWHYLHPIDNVPKVSKEKYYPCQKINIKDKEFLFRILYSKYRISIEAFHSLSDGTGSINFLNTLLLKYFHLQGKKITNVNVLHYDDQPIVDELEDSYLKYFDKSLGVLTRNDEKAAYQLKSDRVISGVLNVYQAEMSTQNLKNVAHKYGLNINELIITLAAWVSYQNKLTNSHLKRRKKPIRIQFAVNLRRFFPSISLRNFTGIGIATLDETPGGKMTFEEVALSIGKGCKEELQEIRMQQYINKNCSLENSIFIKLIPLFIKNIIMKIAFYKVGDNIITMKTTNMGNISTPPEFKEYIDRYEVIVGAQKYNNYSLSLISFNDKTVLTVSNTVKTRQFERDLFRQMADIGIDVTVNYNRGA